MKALLTLAEVLRLRQPIPDRQCGIYFLLKGDEVVYVGRSNNVTDRIRQHAMYRGGDYPNQPWLAKDFDSFSWVSCEEGEAASLEALYIERFAPKQNRRRELVSLHMARGAA